MVRAFIVSGQPSATIQVEELARSFAPVCRATAFSCLETAQQAGRLAPPDVLILDMRKRADNSQKRLRKARQHFHAAAIAVVAEMKDDDYEAACIEGGAQEVLPAGELNENFIRRSLRCALARQRDRLQSTDRLTRQRIAFDQQSVGSLMVDRVGNVQEANNQALWILACEREQLIGKPVPIKRSAESLQEVEYALPDGRVAVLELRISQPHPRDASVCITLLDITSRKKEASLASEIEKLATVSRVCFGVAHEFNNLLAITRTKTDYLETLAQCDPAWDRHIQDLKMACNRGASLVRKLMTFYARKDEAGSAVDMNRFLQEIQPNLQALCGEDHRIKLSPSPVAVSASMNEDFLLEVFSNLVTNARDAMSKGGEIEIDLQLIQRPHAKQGGYRMRQIICAAVKDSGHGIGDSVRGRIFEPFFTTKDTRAGRGLGLSVVANLLREKGGSIEFDTQEGSGSVFRVFLPLSEESRERSSPLAESPTKKAFEPPSSETPGVPQRTRVLVVDDESVLRQSVRQLLEVAGFEATCAETPDAAIELIRKDSSKIDLLLTDMNMPGMNGQELANMAIAHDPSLKVIVMSGFGVGGVDGQWLKARKIEFLSKPFSKAELVKCIQKSRARPNESSLKQRMQASA